MNKGTSQVLCNECNKSFVKRNSQIKEKRNNFCCKSCSASYNNRKHPKRSRKEITCSGEKCDTVLPPRRKYCDPCLTKRAPDWSKVTYGETLGKRKYQKHSRIRSLARKWYEKSDRVKHCSMCGYDKSYQVAHIQAVGDHKNTDTVSYINRDSNLIALCIRCHWELDHHMLSLEEIQNSEFYKD